MDFFQAAAVPSSKKVGQAKPSGTNANTSLSSGKPKPAKSNVVVSTVKRKVIPRPPPAKPATATPSSQDSSRTNSPAANALPAEVRARIEAARAAERERAIEREAEAQVRRNGSKPKSDKKSDASKKSKRNREEDFIDSEEESGVRNTGKPKKSRAKALAEEEDDDSLFGSADEGRSSRPPVSRKQSRQALTPQQNTPSAYTYLGRSGVVQPYLVPRSMLSEDGQEEPSFADFVAEHGQPKSASALVAEAMLKSSGKSSRWGPFFKDLAVSPPPQCTLHYPAEGAQEDFTLLVPRDSDEYDPISDLLRSVYVIVKHYLTDEQRKEFGELSELEMNSMAGQIWAGPLLIDGASEGGETPAMNGGDQSCPATPAHLAAPPSALANLASPTTASNSGATTPLHTPGGSNSNGFDTSSILRSFSKSRNRRNGHLFLHTVTRFNNALSDLRASGALPRNIASLGESGVPEDVWGRIQDQAYARSVAPRVDELASYRSFSDNVYGELTPRFMSEIAQLCNLTPSSTLVDLGCGVGNLVIQTALQVGCESYGVEMMPTPAELGVLQVEEAKKRWAMWGLKGGEMKVWKGDFLEDELVRVHMRKADVVIVNK